MRAKQMSFLNSDAFKDATRTEHGGAVRRAQRKLKRPFDPKNTLHLILKSSRAKGEWSFSRVKNGRQIKHWVFQLARKNRVKVYRLANSGNHLHLLVKAETRQDFQSYLRALTGIISRLVTGAKKGNPIGRFWDALAYTRVVKWGRDFKNVTYYLIRNELEELGIIAYSDRFVRKPRGPPKQNC